LPQRDPALQALQVVQEIVWDQGLDQRREVIVGVARRDEGGEKSS
jgi:hypothetical protein